MKRRSLLLSLCWLAAGCASSAPNPYERATAEERTHLKKVALPFASGTSFEISQGAFGEASHREKGNEFSWDFDVPYGTPVVAVEDGQVIFVHEPNQGAKCGDEKFNTLAHNIQIEHADRTIAQYVHIERKVLLGQKVKKGQIIGVTAKNGNICQPQLHFGIYLSRDNVYWAEMRRTLPILFEGLPDGIARTGLKSKAP